MVHPVSSAVGDADRIVEAVNAWAEAFQSGSASADAAELGRTVEDLLEQDTSYAEQNAKRLRLVCDTLGTGDFENKVKIVDFLLGPLDAIINKMLRRTTVLKQLRFNETRNGETLQELKDYSRLVFLSWTSGTLGRETIRSFLSNLQSLDLATFCHDSDDVSMSWTCFELTLFAMSDVWRRCCHAVSSFPWILFDLSSCSESDFCTKWTAFRATMQRCPECVDAGFSAPLLRALDVAALDGRDRQERVKDVQQLLLDIATFTPLATDTVENLHGQNQSRLFVWRGRARGSPAAAEISVLSALASEHLHLKTLIMPATMPSSFRIAQMQRNIGRKRKAADTVLPHAKTRLAAATCVEPRRLSGWNVFLREGMQQFSSTELSQEEYSAQSSALGRKWRLLDQEVREKYTIKANYEQTCRDELQTRALAAGSGWQKSSTGSDVPVGDVQSADSLSTSQLEKVAGEHFCKKISAKRLVLNDEEHTADPRWATYGLSLQDRHGALRRDLIDLCTPQPTVDAAVHNCMHANLEEPEDGSFANDKGIPSSTCHKLFGYCQLEKFHNFSARFAKLLAKETVQRKLPAGSLLRLQPMRGGSALAIPDDQAFFLGVLCQKPLTQVLVKAWPVTSEGGAVSFAVTSGSGRDMDGVLLLPQFHTSFEIFRNLAVLCDGAVDGITVEIIPCSFEHPLNQWQSMQQLKVVVSSQPPSTFTLHATREEATTSAAQVQLPFGLKFPKKKRAKAKPKARTKKPGPARARGRGRGRRRRTGESVSSKSSKLESSSAASAKPDNDGSDSRSGSDDGADGAGEEDEAVGTLMMPTDDARNEERELALAAGDFEETQQKKAVLADAHRTGGSYFSKEIGFDEGSLAPTGRSKCLHCSGPICKGAPRFSYFWHERRPSRYVHDTCVRRFVQDDVAKEEQAIVAMRQIVRSTPVPEVKSAAERVLSALLPEASASST
ncbi:unnamed protein product [Symbiodinium necroappetens]|uniref:Uncharacterized protein n=1 Tax=Symbiodinium necroappetens TaxID=1628268 RepID=A0A812VTT1_9DINO|nr:unnamed protein product [Symbiodinium necroappetens]